MSSDECEILDKAKSRNFICSCGKAYLSYAALFTHIKLKHNGKAPGPISKPKPSQAKRGRPSNVVVKELNELQLRQKKKNEEIQPILTILRDICSTYNYQQRDEAKLYEQIAQYKYFMNMLAEPIQKISSKGVHPVVKYCFEQFFSQIRSFIAQQPFQELVILLALLTQFMADEFNDGEVLNNAYMDTISEKINEFMMEGYQWLMNRAGITNLWINQFSVILRIIEALFRWAEIKHYCNSQVRIRPQYL